MLKHIVGVLQGQLRSHDPIVRLGGDEFASTVGDAGAKDPAAFDDCRRGACKPREALRKLSG